MTIRSLIRSGTRSPIRSLIGDGVPRPLPGTWMLESSIWSDAGVWLDSETWND